MRLRRRSPLLVLFLASLALADLNSLRTGRLQKRQALASENQLSKDDILRLNQVQDAPAGRAKGIVNANAGVIPDNTYTARPTASTRPYVGTEDAPVDGLDGKPHAGPFVDTTPETTRSRNVGTATTSAVKAVPTSLEKFAEGAADIPEKNDGVMNDEYREAPKKGTTGTEGGISEKEREQKAKGHTEKKPQEPKEAPPLPHSEQERIKAEQTLATQEKDTIKKDSKTSEKEAKVVDAPKKGDYGYGLEKPTDLPEKPHNIPHPDPKGASLPSESFREDGPPVGSEKSSWLQDTMPYTEGQPKPKTKPILSDSSTILGSQKPTADLEWHEWFHSFVLSLTMILFSEIGDKTFLIAALMAMRHPRLLVFSAAFSALITMTILSAVLGHAVPTLLPKRFTTFAAALLFLVFGARMLREGLAMPRDLGVGEEMKEVEAELEEKEHSLARHASRRRSSKTNMDPYTLESGRGRSASKTELSPPSSRSPTPTRNRVAGLTNLVSLVLSPAWVQTFIMTFLGEWGDRSQIATIAMAAGQDYWWVTLGAITGHACCTGVAVLGGRALAGRVSMRVVTIGGAVAFLVFGVIYGYECFVE